METQLKHQSKMKQLWKLKTFTIFSLLLLFASFSFAEDNSTLVVRSVVIVEPPSNTETPNSANNDHKNQKHLPLTTSTQMLYDALKSLRLLLMHVDEEFSTPTIPGLKATILELDSSIFDLLQPLSVQLPLYLSTDNANNNNNNSSVSSISNHWDKVTLKFEQLVNLISLNTEKKKSDKNLSSPPHPIDKQTKQQWIGEALQQIGQVMSKLCKKCSETLSTTTKSTPKDESPRKVLEDLQQTIFFAYELFESSKARVGYFVRNDDEDDDDVLVLTYSDSKK